MTDQASMEPAGSVAGDRELAKKADLSRQISGDEASDLEVVEQAVNTAVNVAVNVSGAAQGIAADLLRSFVERIERLNDEKAALAADSREVYSEAKSNGFDTKAIRKVVKLRAMERADREEQEAILDLYRSALGL